MRSSTTFVLLLVIGIGVCAPQGESEPKESDDSQAYSYNWEVNDADSKNYYGQEQSSNDAGRVEGRYYVWLADGRLMTVSYYVDGDSGFVPKITFSDPNFNPPADAPPKPT